MAKKPTATTATSSAPDLLGILDGITAELGIKEGKTYRPVPTGINVLDYYNGRYFHNEELQEHELFTGLPSGKMIGFIGFTGVGKTTLCVQTAMALVAPYELGSVYHFDLENAFSEARVGDITQLPMSLIKRKYRRFPPVSLEKIYSFIKKVREAKLKAMAEDERVWVIDVRTGERIPAPTVVILDTVAALQSEAVMNENTEMGSLMYEKGAQAGANNAFAQRLAGLIGEANITVMWVNHIRDKIEQGPVKKAKRIQYLAMDETTPGGAGFPQYADYMLKMTPQTIDDGFDIPGKIVRCTIVKSRLSYDGRQFHLVLTADGISNAWSNLVFLKEQKLLRGAGAHLFLEGPDGRPTQKFPQKRFAELYGDDGEFREIVDSLLEAELLRLIPLPGSAEEAAVMTAAEEEAEGAVAA